VIDTHAHLDGCDDPAAELVDRARAVGVTRVITIGTGVDSCRRALAIAEQNDGVYAALGIDPHQAATGEAARIDELRELLAHPKAVAVGEAGLDYFYGPDRKDEQARLFEAQLALAEELGKPVVIHTRDAEDDTAAALAGFGGTVVMHCFSSPKLTETVVERGYYVSFAGNLTYPKAEDLRAAAARVPPDRLLAETDSPYLAPQPRRGKPNEPANVVHTLAALAETRGDDPAELERRIDANATAAFRLP
jgi:TatD DNase family protein